MYYELALISVLIAGAYWGWYFVRHEQTRLYGGLQGFRRFRPFFLGLVLGEFLTAAAWMGIDALLGVRGHNVFPG